MRTLVCTKAGDLDRIVIKDVSAPEPKENEVQIAVRAVALSALDFSVFTEKAEKGKVSFLSKILTESFGLLIAVLQKAIQITSELPDRSQKIIFQSESTVHSVLPENHLAD